MSRNGSGTYTKVNTFTAGTTITAAGHNANWDDIASEMTNSVAVDGQSTMTGPLKVANGTAAAPSITFGSNTDMGLYRIAADNLGLSVFGTKIGDFFPAGVAFTGVLSCSGAFTASSGVTISAGGLIITAGGIGVAAGGIGLVTDTFMAPTGSASAPTYTFNSDSNTGIYRIGADNIGVAANGAKVLDIGASGLGVTGVVSASGSVKSSSASGGVGYDTGAGGTVTQATSKSTAVTLNVVCGQIIMHNASLAGGGRVEFTFNNSAIAAADVVKFCISGGVATGGVYMVDTKSVSAGSCVVGVSSNAAGALGEAVELNFVVLKAVRS